MIDDHLSSMPAMAHDAGYVVEFYWFESLKGVRRGNVQMIDKVLSFIAEKLNATLESQYPSSEPHAVMGQIGDISSTVLESKVIVSLANLEYETRIQRTNLSRGGPTPLPINIFILVVANFGDNYADALKFLSAALVYFHSSPVMTPATLSDFPTDIEKLTIEFVNLSLQEVSNLWTVRGSLYLPSFVLKLTPGR
jgi:hypothetical protein